MASPGCPVATAAALCAVRFKLVLIWDCLSGYLHVLVPQPLPCAVRAGVLLSSFWRCYALLSLQRFVLRQSSF